jgi:hypothetical protein
MVKGWVEVAQRCGRNAYRRVMVHVTNPDHYEPPPPDTSGKFLKIDPKYR